MNIAIEARSLSAQTGGVKTYTHQLLRHLITAYSQEHFECIYSSRKPLGIFSNVQETVIPLYSEAFLPLWMRTVNRHVTGRAPNVVHYTKAAIPTHSDVPTVVTIYDTIPILFPETQSPLRRLYWPRALRYAATHADHIITISQSSKWDIMEHFGTHEDTITITQLAVDQEHFRPVRASSTPGVNDETPGVFPARPPYILFVGTRDARKNISSLIRAFAKIAHEIPHQLLIVGRPAKKQDDSRYVARYLNLESRVVFREDSTYKDLPALYSNADIFVWPSLYEGWAFPVQEAMACGCPVIVSDGGALPEVVGDAGVIVPLGEEFEERLTREMLSLIQNNERKRSLSKRGITRAAQFSWEDVANKTWEVYKTIAR